MQKHLIVFLMLIATTFGSACARTDASKPSVSPVEGKLTEMGAAAVKKIDANKPTYDRMDLAQRGMAYSFQLLEGRKISIETNFKGEVVILSPNGEELKKITNQNKIYYVAKGGKYYLWFKNNAIPNDYYIIVKTYDKVAFLDDADELPGTKIERDGLVSGVVDSKTDAEDYYYFPVVADDDVHIYYTNPQIKVTVMNKLKQETTCLSGTAADIFVMQTGEMYLKVTAKDGAVGVPYEINFKRIKNKL